MTATALSLRDARLDGEFRTEGYVRIPFLTVDQLDDLRDLWHEISPSEVTGIYSNIHDLTPSANRRIDVRIRSVLQPAFERVFLGAWLAGASFLVKGCGADSASSPHQDWNNVDESASQSCSVWVPLVDVDESNGALVVMPKSHRLRPSIRSLDTPSLYVDFEPDVAPLFVSVPACAGDAVIYAHNLFHGSRPNSSDSVRVAVAAGAVPEGTQLVHYRHSPGGPAEMFDVLEIDPDFFFSGVQVMSAGRLPATARRRGQVFRSRPRIELGELKALLT